MTCMTCWNPFRGLVHIDPTADAEVRGAGPRLRWNELAIAPDMHTGISEADATSRHAEKYSAPSHSLTGLTVAPPGVAPTSVPEQ